MHAIPKKRPAEADPTQDRIVDVLLEIEPELRQLNGLLIVLTALGEAADLVDPIALSSLGRSTRDAFDRIDESWRTLLAETRQ